MLSQEAETNRVRALGVYYKRETTGSHISASYQIAATDAPPRGPMISDSNVELSAHSFLTPQEVCARLAYNRPYVGRSVTDTIGHDGFYKHQVLVCRQMFQNDSCLVMHDPGTGKTITHLYAMMELLKAGVIKRIVLFNQSDPANRFAQEKLEELYTRLYQAHYGLTYRQFSLRYLNVKTLHNLGDYPYKSHYGIIIDEAHNMLSDNDSEKEMKKVANASLFLDKISQLEGIKLLLLTATPLFGNIASLGKFRQILYRNKQQNVDHIPPCLISYTQISYTHLNIIQRTNPAYPGIGDRSFELTNGRMYEFKLYCTKPSPMQIADFAKLAAKEKGKPFQAENKPRIVSSLPYETIETDSDGRRVIAKRQQSAIGQEILKLISKTADGTIIIYCDLRGDGAIAMAEFLDQHGFEPYITRDTAAANAAQQNAAARAAAASLRTNAAQIHECEVALSQKHTRLRTLRRRLSETSQVELDGLMEQLDVYEQLPEDESYDDIYDSMSAYINEYQSLHNDNTEITQAISELEEDVAELEEELERLRPRVKGKDGKGPQRYLLYLSDMDSKAKTAFREVFNSRENWDGSRIKVIIGSRVMRDGVDCHHAVQTHIIIPEWRIPGYIQAQHRGIRSSGHKWLIHHRAIKLVEKDRLDRSIAPENKITYEQATRMVVDVEIFNHLVDLSLITEEDIHEAREFINKTSVAKKPEEKYTEQVEELRSMSDKDVLRLMTSSGARNSAGEAIIDAAIKSYSPVGAEMMTLRSSALDYKLNVKKEARVRDSFSPAEEERQKHFYTHDDLLATKDTELFFMKDNSDILCEQITKLLLERGYINTDDLFELLMAPPPIITILGKHKKRPEELFDELTASRQFVNEIILNRGSKTEEQLVAEIARDYPLLGELLRNEYHGTPIIKFLDEVNRELARLESYSGPPSEQMIATAIIELTQFRGRVYHEYLGTELYVKLYERTIDLPNGRKETTESILYLCTTRNESLSRDLVIHPYIAVTRNIGFSTYRYMERAMTTVREEDLIVGKGSNLFHKIQDVLKRALEGEDINLRDLRFLTLMSNYWAFSWRDVESIEANPEASHQKNVYVFEKHINRPAINVLAHDLDVHGYDTSSKRWTRTSTQKLKNIVLVRYASLMELYRTFKFYELPEFAHYFNFTDQSVKEKKDTNGILFVKDFYQPADPDGDAAHLEDYINNLFARSLSGDKLGEKFVLKKFLMNRSRGSKISNDLGPSRNYPAVVREFIRKNLGENIVVPFFLFGKDEMTIDSNSTIFDIKLAELREMKLAVAGTPTLRFQIHAIESQINDPARKKEIYRSIYRLQ